MSKHTKSLMLSLFLALAGSGGLIADDNTKGGGASGGKDAALSPEQTKKLQKALGDVVAAMDDEKKKLEPVADGLEKMGDAANSMAEGMMLMLDAIEKQLSSIPPSQLTEQQKKELADLQAKKAQLKIDIDKNKREMEELKAKKSGAAVLGNGTTKPTGQAGR